MSFFGKRKPVARRFALLYYEFGITTYTFRYARLAPTDLVFFGRTAIISRTGNHRTTPIPAAIAIATGIGPTIVPTTRLRRFRVARLFRLRVRCRLSRCGIACRGRTTRTGGGITLVGTLAGVLHNFLGLDGQLVGRIHQAARPEPCRLYRRWPPPHQ
jgi:hypothetical protein